MSRAVRTARGALAASAATLLAAVSHSIAGGDITPAAVVATFMLALPVCVALAGRMGSLWRLSTAVVLSQVPYHWTFWGLGTGSATESGSALTGHAAHLSVVFSPSAVASGAAEASMWLSHAVAAVVTIALLHRGERAALRVARVIRRALPLTIPEALPVPDPVNVSQPIHLARVRDFWVWRSPISHRGPPTVLVFAP